MATGEASLHHRWASLRFLQGPSRVLVLTGPLFTAYAMVVPFAVLYMKLLGLTDAEIGLLASLALGLRFVFLLAGGYLADHWGRRPTITFFDFIGFPLAFTVLALAQSFPWFLAGMALNAASQGSQAAWQCILVEEVPPGNRARVAAAERLMNLGPSLVMPLAGSLWVLMWGLVPATRAMYGVAAGAISLMVCLRLYFMPPSGQGVVDAHRGLAPFASLASFLGAVRFLLTDWRARRLLAASLALAFASGLGIFYSIYVVEDVQVPAYSLGILAAVATAVGLIAVLPFTRVLKVGREPQVLSLSSGMGLTSTVAFLLARNLSLLMVASLLGGISYLVWTVASTALWANVTPDGLRAKVVSSVQALTAGISIPSGALAAYLWRSIAHQAPWYIVLGLQGFTVLILVIPPVRGGGTASL